MASTSFLKAHHLYLIDKIEQKSRENNLPTALKIVKAAGYSHPPTAFADYICVLMISWRQWVNLFGQAVPIRVVATVKVRNKKLIHFHFSEDSIL
jgi:hypothetical protein